MNHETEQAILAEIRSFVAGLDGRYREHCSDEFLSRVILERFRRPRRHDGVSRGDVLVILKDITAAYDAACNVFESILEHGCQAGGNGHHVAQAFSAHMNEVFVKP